MQRVPAPHRFIRPRNRFRTAAPRRGAALVVVLGLLAVLMLMAVAFAIAMRTERGGSSNLRHALIARQMLDTAVSRAMADLDEELGTEPAPPWLMLASTNRFRNSDHRTAGVLSYEAAQYLPPDQLFAARRANPGWLAVTAGVASNAADDVVAGRYAYIILNNTGFLDANLVGANTNRGHGTRAAEIRLWADNGGLATVASATDAQKFADRRERNHGRYESGSEFFRLTPKKNFDGTPNANGSLTMERDKPTSNSFALSSFALESWGPHTADPSTYQARPAKHYLDPTLPTVYNAATGAVLTATFTRAFQGASNGCAKASGDPDYGTAATLKAPCNNGTISQIPIAVAGLLDYMDEDVLPGRNSAGTEYATVAGVHWSDRPCTEPVPMFNRFVVLRDNGTYTTEPVHQNGNPAQPIVATKHKFPPLKFFGSTVFLNRTVPDAAQRDFDTSFAAANVEMDPAVLAAVAGTPYEAALITAIQAWQMEIHKDGPHNPGTTASPNRYNDLEVEVPGLEFDLPVGAALPDEVVVMVNMLALVELGGKEIQKLPSETLQSQGVPFRIGLYLSPSRLANPGANYVGWAYVADPRFASCTFDFTSPTAPGSSAMIWMTRDRARTLQQNAASTDPALIAWLDTLDPQTTPRTDANGFPGTAPYVSPFMHFLLTGATPASYCGKSSPYVMGLEWPEWSDSFYYNGNENDPDCIERVLTMVRNGYPESIGELGNLVLAPLRTLSLFDGQHPADSGLVVPRHTVLDWFTLHRPRGPSAQTGAYLTCKLNGRLNLNPPFAVATNGTSVVTDRDPNYEPLTAAFAGLPLNEYGAVTTTKNLPWSDAAALARTFANDVLGWQQTPAAPNDHMDIGFNKYFITYDLSVLGRTPAVRGSSPQTPDPANRLDRKLATLSTRPACDFEREAIIRNSVELFTTRQQLFTIILRADAFTPKFGFSDAGEGTTLSTAHAIVEVWRDPEPARDANGNVLWYVYSGGHSSDEDKYHKPIHPWFIRYLHQF